MSLKILELGRFNLVSLAEPLKLEVVAAVDFEGPKSICDLDANAFVCGVASRHVWVSRGRGCRIDIEVLLNGKPLNRTYDSQLLESLGCQIRDVNVRFCQSLGESLLTTRSHGSSCSSQHRLKYPPMPSSTDEYPISRYF